MSLRERKKADTHERILDACKALFREKGFDDTTVVDIIDAVGISRQTFFNYFAGKEAVLTELGLIWLREQAEIPRVAPERIGTGSILRGTRAAILTQVRAVEADADFMRLVFTRSGLLFPQTRPQDEVSERIRRDHTHLIFERVAAVMTAAQQAGEIRADIAPMQAAELYVTTVLMTIRFWITDYWREATDLEERVGKALDVLEAGLAPQS